MQMFCNYYNPYDNINTTSNRIRRIGSSFTEKNFIFAWGLQRPGKVVSIPSAGGIRIRRTTFKTSSPSEQGLNSIYFCLLNDK
jgi:hypothetical protein